jgi:hypothetical protein
LRVERHLLLCNVAVASGSALSYSYVTTSYAALLAAISVQ